MEVQPSPQPTLTEKSHDLPTASTASAPVVALQQQDEKPVSLSPLFFPIIPSKDESTRVSYMALQPPKQSLTSLFSPIWGVLIVLILAATIVLFVWSNTSNGAWVKLTIEPFNAPSENSTGSGEVPVDSDKLEQILDAVRTLMDKVACTLFLSVHTVHTVEKKTCFRMSPVAHISPNNANLLAQNATCVFFPAFLD